MSRTLIDIEVHETIHGMNAYTRRDVRGLIDDRIVEIEVKNKKLESEKRHLEIGYPMKGSIYGKKIIALTEIIDLNKGAIAELIHLKGDGE